MLDHVIARDETARRGSAIWYAFVAAAASDPRIAAILAEARRGVEDAAATLLDRLGHPGDTRVRARHLMARADGLAVRVLIGDVDPGEALAQLYAETHPKKTRHPEVRPAVGA